MKAKVVIVGGGVMGTAIAWHAAKRADAFEEPVVLLEKKALAAGSSGRSGAILRQHYSDVEVAAMARDSLRVYASLEEKTGRSIRFQACGVITLAGPTRPADMALVARNVEMQRSIGIDTRLVDAREIRELVHGIAIDDAAVGAYERSAGSVDPVRTVEVLAALAREQGAITRIETRVTELLVERGRIRGVATDRGSIEAEQVVIAAGPWTRTLLASTGVDLPLRVLRPEQHFLKTPSTGREARASEERVPIGELEFRFTREEAPPPAPHPVLLDLEYGFYTRCETYASRTRVGRMDYEGELEVDDPDALDEEVSGEFKRWSRGVLVKRLPQYREQPDADSLVGMYTVTPDAQAIIGPCRGIEGLFVVSGFSGHGFKLAPSIGEGVAQMLWNEPISAFEPQFFDPYRFEKERAGSKGRAFGL